MIYFNVPFLAIPLPNSKDNHQFYNAKDYFDKNGYDFSSSEDDEYDDDDDWGDDEDDEDW